MPTPKQQVRKLLRCRPAAEITPLSTGSFGTHQILCADIRSAFHRILAPRHLRPAIFLDQISLLVATVSLFQRSKLSGRIGAILETDNAVRRCYLCAGSSGRIRCHLCCGSAGDPTAPSETDHYGSCDAS